MKTKWLSLLASVSLLVFSGVSYADNVADVGDASVLIQQLEE